ncbi:uncharacterized protein C8Q71DRAFT_725810 [Rhodofomes roseus]|uniref:RNase H type-1 domain-containing protein n=1 Tax=Rhodofomes roseus TaxID=34475 RepID=A0ABQ8K7I0_9APHY|nr:uncharacterized protein C8Q71DRAFT_725810 [Rhodofomes roseus]KAH9833132.1 hypothetical protein C8Q71DRAFT_725810 [Rhodofomes roseus]
MGLLPEKWNPQMAKPEDEENRRKTEIDDDNEEESKENQDDLRDEMSDHDNEEQTREDGSDGGNDDNEREDNNQQIAMQRPNRKKKQDEGQWEMFDHRLTTKGTMADVFRIFTTGDTSNETYKPINIRQTNQTAELTASTVAGKKTPYNRKLDVESDSNHVITEATKYRVEHEDNGYIGKANAPLIRAMIAALRARPHLTRLKWVRGHNGHRRNERADALAGKGAKKRQADKIDLSIPSELSLTRAKLATLTQKVAYRGIRERKMNTYQQRRRTETNMIKITDYVQVYYKKPLSEAQAWKGMRNKDLQREIRYFLWMSTHDVYMVGSNWLRPSYSDELQERHECKICGVEESIDHILTDCEAPGQEIIWELAGKLWKMKQKTWNKPLLGGILGCGSTEFKTKKGKILKGEARLHRTVISESVYLIWKLRNEQVIQAEGDRRHSEDEITNRWLQAINDRLAIDCNMTNTTKYGKKAIRPEIVKQTWRGVLRNEAYLPYDWAKGHVEVLVGIERKRSRGLWGHTGD